MVSHAGLLDLDYIGPKIRQHLCADSAGQQSGQIEHPDSIERFHLPL
jgi:hypothetical protein